MTTSDRDPILDAFERHLAAVERLIPADPPAFVGQDERKPIRVVRRDHGQTGQGPGSGRRLTLVLAPIGIAAVVIAAIVGVGLMTRPDEVPGGVVSTPAASPCSARRLPDPIGLGHAATFRRSVPVPHDRVPARAGAPGRGRLDDRHQFARRALTPGPDRRPSTEVGTLTIAALDNLAVDTCVAIGDAGKTRPWAPSAPADGHRSSWIGSRTGAASRTARPRP